MMGSSILYGILPKLQIPWLMPPSPNDQIFFLGSGKSLFFNTLDSISYGHLSMKNSFSGNFLIPIISMKYRYLVASIISSILFSLMHLEPSALIPVFLLVFV
ncbi:MAG: hypothetical protein CM1200mP38_4230 [Dehalococcoidia bacterium]|nr:MAG: hypothetical protein CM1200mP38_4230 [Dehalococcoidia bacterium]